MSRDRFGGALLLSLGVLTLGTGVHFLVLRPAMLPEDVRFTGMDPQALQPRMAEWLEIVFRTWGGFIAGFGIVLAALGGYTMTLRQGLLRWGVAIGTLVAFGRFLVSNLAIHSDYLPFVGALFALASLTALRFALRRPVLTPRHTV